MLRKILVSSVLLLPLFTFSAQAQWTLQNESSNLNFISTKADKVAEVHRFNTLSGKVDDSGLVEIAIDLTSVDTGIAIRDERMQNVLFETDRFAVAVLKAQIDAATISQLQTGATANLSVESELTLHGKSQPLTLALTVIRLSDDELLAISKQPVIVNAAAFELAEGIESLREIAGLPSISTAVPISFRLTFKQ